jgi:hypothetical protein
VLGLSHWSNGLWPSGVLGILDPMALLMTLIALWWIVGSPVVDARLPRGPPT